MVDPKEYTAMENRFTSWNISRGLKIATNIMHEGKDYRIRASDDVQIHKPAKRRLKITN